MSVEMSVLSTHCLISKNALPRGIHVERIRFSVQSGEPTVVARPLASLGVEAATRPADSRLTSRRAQSSVPIILHTALPQSEVPHRLYTPHRAVPYGSIDRRGERKGEWETWGWCVDNSSGGDVTPLTMLDDASFPAADKILCDIETAIRRNPTL